MGQVITDIAQVTPVWLNSVLQQAGGLGHGPVTDIEFDTSRPFGAVVSKLTVIGAENQPTHRLFLKLADAETHQQWPGRGSREVEFYGAIPAEHYARLPIPRCYHAGWLEAGYHLLLDDLTTTHKIIPHPLPPNQRQAEQVVDALARLHAYWWNDARLGAEMGRSAEQKTVFNGDEEYFLAFADFLGDALWDERRAIFQRAMEAAPRLHERLKKGNLTLIHGDAHAWNFLYPRESGGAAALVDWEAWDADVGVFDLAYLMTLFWFPAHRARTEKALVRRYHNRLIGHGIVGYSWDDCWYDYRHSVIRLLFRPTWWWRERPDNEGWAEIWWPRLERVICAYQDLNCEELLS
jgi:hypothetical protein